MKPTDLPALITARTEPNRDPDRCGWFLHCENPADGLSPHPILGLVPCCSRCADNLDLELEANDQ